MWQVVITNFNRGHELTNYYSAHLPPVVTMANARVGQSVLHALYRISSTCAVEILASRGANSQMVTRIMVSVLSDLILLNGRSVVGLVDFYFVLLSLVEWYIKIVVSWNKRLIS
jgi:hypothetical protein